MFTVILGVALVCQAPTPTRSPTAAPKASALARAPRVVPQTRAVPRSTRRTEADRLIARRKAHQHRAYVGRINREAREAQLEGRALQEAKAEFERTLPARLELSRQLLQRQTDLERNRLMQREVGAMERAAGLVYPGQSPIVGPYLP